MLDIGVLYFLARTWHMYNLQASSPPILPHSCLLSVGIIGILTLDPTGALIISIRLIFNLKIPISEGLVMVTSKDYCLSVCLSINEGILQPFETPE